MQIKDLNYYVKFEFLLKGQVDNFITSDITVLKEVVANTDFKIGDILYIDGKNCLIENISIKHVNETTRSNITGFNSIGDLQGQKKDSLITVVIEFSEQH